MEQCGISGKLSLQVTDSAITLKLEGDFSKVRQEQKEDPRDCWLDVLQGFDGEEVDVQIICYHPHLGEKKKALLASAGAN